MFLIFIEEKMKNMKLLRNIYKCFNIKKPMTELFVYDASEVNRQGESFHEYPVEYGFRRSLRLLRPPKPFLLRGFFGDFEYERNNSNYTGKLIIKNTFKKRTLESLLRLTLENGNDKSDPKGKEHPHPYEKKLQLRKRIKFSDILWATEVKSIQLAIPYRYDDSVFFPQGLINDFTMIMDPKLYTRDSISLFYQPDISLRKQALLGIIISDTNPNRPQLQPMRFTLTPENLEEVVRQIQKLGYFAAV